MKYLFPLTFTFIFIFSEAFAQNQNQYAQAVSSLDHILDALYASISEEKGEKRDWEHFRNLFVEEARLMPSRKNEEGKIAFRILTPDSYIETSGKWLEENGFYEVEINREV